MMSVRVKCIYSRIITTIKIYGLRIYDLRNVIYVNLTLFMYVMFPDELVNEKEKYKSISDELDVTFSELTGY